jgi:hypothetical protein
LKTIEKRLPDSRAAAARKKRPEKDELLFMENEEYQAYCIEWLMSLYMGDTEKAAEMKVKADSFLESLEPKMKPSQFDEAAYNQLVVVKVVDWMEENDLKDIDEERWEALFNGPKIET